MRVVTTKHGHMILDEESKDFITGWLLLNGEYEWDVVNLCSVLASSWDDGTILDIGANLGTVTIPLASMFPHFKIHAYEPQRIVAYQLSGNVTLNKCRNVEVHQYALGEVNKTLSVRLPDYTTADNVGAFTLDPHVMDNEPMSQGHGEVEEIEVRRLDDSEFKDVRLIKLDVEGYELNVLKGAVATLEKHSYPPIVYESWNYHKWWEARHKELQDWLVELGYESHAMDMWTNVATHPNHPVKLFVQEVDGVTKYMLENT